MYSMDRNNKIQKYLNKILKSNEFSDSEKYQELLEYLVKRTLCGDIPKEVTIANDVFDKPIDIYKKHGSQVRVYVHNLRMNLDSYYQHEGRNDKILLEIPKGHYKVNFEKRKTGNQFTKKNIIIALNIIALIILFLVDFFLIKHYKNQFPESKLTASPVWKDLLTSKEPVMVVIGDYYLYKAENVFGIDRHLYIRDFNINSDTDFVKNVSNFEIDNEIVRKSNHTLLGKYAPWSIYNITKLFNYNNKEFELKLSSNLQWQDINKYNIIFIGTFKSLGIVNELISDLNFSYQVHPNRLNYFDPKTDSVFTYITTSSSIHSAYENDYSVVAKLPASEQTSIIIFGSTRDIGCIAMVDYLTNHSTLTSFSKKYGLSVPKNSYFESVFKIQGFERNVNDIGVLHFNKIQ